MPAAHRELLGWLPWIAMAWSISWFVLLAAHPLFNPDEGRYAEIPREMLASGDWLIPHLNGLIYIEKPPLQYWFTALSYALFGPSDWSARLYTGACGFLTVLLASGLGLRLWGRAAGWRAGFMTASSLLIVVLAHQLTLDMSLSFLMCVSCGGICLAQTTRGDGAQSRAWMLLAWIAAALGVLTKGLVALVLPALTLVAYSLLARDRLLWKQLEVRWGIALLLLIAAPWFVLMARAVPGFLDFFFVREHLLRYLTRISDRHQSWWFFIPILIIGCSPWWIPAVRALRTGFAARAPRDRFEPRLFLSCWIAVTFCFFSLSDSKLIPYILPLFPALSVLMAGLDEADLRRDLRTTGSILLGCGCVCIVIALSTPSIVAAFHRGQSLLALTPYNIGIGVVAIAGGLIARRIRHGSVLATAVIASAAYVCFALFVVSTRTASTNYSGASLAAQLPESLASQAPFFSVRTYDQTLAFYLRRPAILVDRRDELDFGLELAPGQGIASLDEFMARWRKLDQAIAVMDPQTYSELERRALPMVIRARDGQRLIVSIR